MRVRDQGVTILISSHILRELDDLCDRVAIIQSGRVVVAGPVADIVESHEVTRFVYELRFLSGADRAQAVLAAHRCLIEENGVEDGLVRLRVQVQGDEALMARILADLVAHEIPVVTCSRLKSRLEDVYDRLSDDTVN
jgi:ABC-2 type transport system ATP-binding protein